MSGYKKTPKEREVCERLHRTPKGMQMVGKSTLQGWTESGSCLTVHNVNLRIVTGMVRKGFFVMRTDESGVRFLAYRYVMGSQGES